MMNQVNRKRIKIIIHQRSFCTIKFYKIAGHLSDILHFCNMLPLHGKLAVVQRERNVNFHHTGHLISDVNKKNPIVNIFISSMKFIFN